MGLVVDEQRRGLVTERPHARQETLLREHDADIGERRLTEHRCDVAGRQRRLERGEIVELNDARRRRRIRRGRDVAGSVSFAALLVEHDEGLVHGAVIRVGKDQHLGAPGHHARESQRPAVRVARREGEGPAGRSESPGQLLGDPLRVRGGQHRGDAASYLHALAYRLDQRRWRVSRHRAGVPQTEVGELVSIEIGDRRAAGGGKPQREAAGPFAHPGHRHAAEEIHRRVAERE